MGLKETLEGRRVLFVSYNGMLDPLGQSQELYRGLKHYGVESVLVEYPREPHGFREEKHLLDRLNRILAWYDKYVK